MCVCEGVWLKTVSVPPGARARGEGGRHRRGGRALGCTPTPRQASADEPLSCTSALELPWQRVLMGRRKRGKLGAAELHGKAAASLWMAVCAQQEYIQTLVRADAAEGLLAAAR